MKIPDLICELTVAEVEEAILAFIKTKVDKKISFVKPIFSNEGFTLTGYEFGIAVKDLLPNLNHPIVGHEENTRETIRFRRKNKHQIDLSTIDYDEDDVLDEIQIENP